MQLLGGVFYSCEMCEICFGNANVLSIFKTILLGSFHTKHLKYEKAYVQVKVEMKVDCEQFCFQRSSQSFCPSLKLLKSGGKLKTFPH